MSSKYFLTALLAANVVLMFSCKKPAASVLPAPDPILTPDYRVVRQFQYFNGKVVHAEYKILSIGCKATFHKDSSIFKLDFAADTIRDEFHIEFKTENVNQNSMVSYPVQRRMNHMNEGYITYNYHDQPTSLISYPGNVYSWEGYINILSYDAKRKLITGDCRVSLNDMYDPVNGNRNEKCKIVLLCLFGNIKYEEVP